ncbi:MAG TPA: hypothetical protein DCP90_08100 [Clostridiales bacterium]|nr:MAG: hypothetical protein A2Y22_00130 [Clostridiales bacterium GWD2_32_59]HAN10553.1 hypothetical protein [Clostridiales bacterium]
MNKDKSAKVELLENMFELYTKDVRNNHGEYDRVAHVKMMKSILYLVGANENFQSLEKVDFPDDLNDRVYNLQWRNIQEFYKFKEENGNIVLEDEYGMLYSKNGEVWSTYCYEDEVSAAKYTVPCGKKPEVVFSYAFIDVYNNDSEVNVEFGNLDSEVLPKKEIEIKGQKLNNMDLAISLAEHADAVVTYTDEEMKLFIEGAEQTVEPKAEVLTV